MMKAKKWDEAAHQKHMDRVKTISACVDTSSPMKHAESFFVASRRIRLEEGTKTNILLKVNFRTLSSCAYWNGIITTISHNTFYFGNL